MVDRTPPRRSFLAALSVFAAVPAAVVTPTLAAAAKVEPGLAEAPELLALGVELRSRLATYREAAAQFVAAREHYEHIKPAVPDELIVPAGADRWFTDSLSAREMDLDGNEASPPRRIYDRRSLQAHIIVQDVPRTTKEGRRLRRLARLAKAHEAAMDAAAQEAGYYDAEYAARAAAAAVSGLTHLLLQAEPVTLGGVRILAEATAGVWEARKHTGGIGHTYAAGLGVHLAGSLLRIESGDQ